MCHASALAGGHDQEKICTAVLAIARRIAALAPAGFGNQPDPVHAQIAQCGSTTGIYPLRRQRGSGTAERDIVDKICVARRRTCLAAGRSCRR